jgi:hypothetical protein
MLIEKEEKPLMTNERQKQKEQLDRKIKLCRSPRTYDPIHAHIEARRASIAALELEPGAYSAMT